MIQSQTIGHLFTAGEKGVENYEPVPLEYVGTPRDTKADALTELCRLRGKPGYALVATRLWESLGHEGFPESKFLEALETSTAWCLDFARSAGKKATTTGTDKPETDAAKEALRKAASIEAAKIQKRWGTAAP